METESFISRFKTEVICFIDEMRMDQAVLGRKCGMQAPNFNQLLNSKDAGMRLHSFCEMYVQMGGELLDILECLRKRQAEKKQYLRRYWKPSPRLKPKKSVQLAFPF